MIYLATESDFLRFWAHRRRPQMRMKNLNLGIDVMCFIVNILDHCDMPLGLEDGRVPNPVMTASSYNNIYDAPYNARLNRRRHGRLGGGWSPRRNDKIRWLQIDFQALTKATRVATQGMHNANYWVKRYYIKYGKNKNRLTPYREGRKTRVSFI